MTNLLTSKSNEDIRALITKALSIIGDSNSNGLDRKNAQYLLNELSLEMDRRKFETTLIGKRH